MQEEVKRILKLLEEGKLNGEQAREMINVLNDAEQRAGRGQRGWRHRRRRGFESAFDGLGADVEQAVENAVGSVLGALGGRKGDDWLDESNDAIFANAERPVGEGYQLGNNRIVVSRLAGLRLHNAQFCANEMHASALVDLHCKDCSFNDNVLRASSLKRVDLDGSDVIGNVVDGSQLAGLKLDSSSLLKNTFKGVRLKKLVLSAGANLTGTRFSGINGGGLTLSATKMLNCEFVNCTFDDTVIEHIDRAEELRFEDVDFSGHRIGALEELKALAAQSDDAH